MRAIVYLLFSFLILSFYPQNIYCEDVVIKMKPDKRNVSDAGQTNIEQPRVYRKPSSGGRERRQVPNFEEIKKKSEDRKKEMLEELKKRNPKVYEKHIKGMKDAEEKSEILKSFRSGKITEAQARQQLRPFVENEINVENYLKNIDRRIAGAEEELEKLRKIKQNPKLLIEESLDRLLGKMPVRGLPPGIKARPNTKKK